MASLISEPTLKELVEANAIREAVLVADAQKDGFAVVVRVGMSEKRLRSKRRDERIFKTLDTAGRYLRSVGIPRFSVDASSWTRAV